MPSPTGCACSGPSTPSASGGPAGPSFRVRPSRASPGPPGRCSRRRPRSAPRKATRDDPHESDTEVGTRHGVGSGRPGRLSRGRCPPPDLPVRRTAPQKGPWPSMPKIVTFRLDGYDGGFDQQPEPSAEGILQLSDTRWSLTFADHEIGISGGLLRSEFAVDAV